MTRNELVERSMKYVAHIQRVDELVRIARDPLAQSARENLSQSIAKIDPAVPIA
jgi:hypothetical protein